MIVKEDCWVNIRSEEEGIDRHSKAFLPLKDCLDFNIYSILSWQN